jgi:hypothetical protein
MKGGVPHKSGTAARLRAQKKANEAEGGGGVICTGGCPKADRRIGVAAKQAFDSSGS